MPLFVPSGIINSLESFAGIIQLVSNSTEIEVQFGDCDPAGIVFYPNYFRWADVGFARLIASTGLERKVIQRFPLVQIGARFRSPTSVGDILRVVSSVTEIKNKSIRVSHLFFAGDTLAVEGWEVRVWRSDNPAVLEAEALPPDLISRFSNGQ